METPERETSHQILLALKNPNLNDSDYKKHIFALLKSNPQSSAEIPEDQVVSFGIQINCLYFIFEKNKNIAYIIHFSKHRTIKIEI